MNNITELKHSEMIVLKIKNLKKYLVIAIATNLILIATLFVYALIR
jgi:hypothetical protein